MFTINSIFCKRGDNTNNKLPQLPDYDNCLVNLANSVLKRFGCQTMHDTLPLADRYLYGGHRNVVVLILDAMGVSIMEKHLDKDGFFRSHTVGQYHSVYPPTTVAATTSVMSGLYPNEHGWLGWDVYYPQVDKNVVVFRNLEQHTEKAGAVPGSDGWDVGSLNEQLPAADYIQSAEIFDLLAASEQHQSVTHAPADNGYADIQYNTPAGDAGGWIYLKQTEDKMNYKDVEGYVDGTYDTYLFGYSVWLPPKGQTAAVFDKLRLRSMVDGDITGKSVGQVTVRAYTVQKDDLNVPGVTHEGTAASQYTVQELTELYKIIENKRG